LRATHGSPIVYDCHDLLEGFDNIDADLCRAEQDSINTADLAVFSSDWLAQEHMARNPAIAEKTAVIRNGVTPGDFHAVGGESDVRKEAPTVGYVGALNWWFDAEMVATAARSHPEWRFLLVGPVASLFPRAVFAGLPNVQFVGEVSYRELPHWLRQFDAGIIPFHLEPLTLATNPVKLYEYLACGFPIVSTALPEVERYGYLVNVAYNSPDFVRQLEKSLSENSSKLAAERHQAAARETWSARAEALEVEFARLSRRENGDGPLNPDRTAAHGAVLGSDDRKIETLGCA
jgi:glycosyltransferase involved in cell wall biosynthesis